MRNSAHLILAAVFLVPVFSANARMVSPSTADSARVEVTAKSADRSFSGTVRSIGPNGLLRVRDDRLADIKVVITTATALSKNGQSIAFRSITVGMRLHGFAAFRGDKYFAKVATID